MASNSTTTGVHARKTVPAAAAVSSNVSVKVPSMSSLDAVSEMDTSAVPPDAVAAYVGFSNDGDGPRRSTRASAYVAVRR